jgi:NADH dehydrogenase
MIAIAGGSGRLGRTLIPLLLARGREVRVLTRDAGHIPADMARHVEVRAIDLRDPHGLRAALDGVETVVSAITGFGGPGAEGARAVDHEGNLRLIEAAEAAGARRFVLVSVANAAPDAPVALFRAKHAAERRLERSGLAWTIVRPTAYMETWLEFVGRPYLETGRTRVFGRGRNPVNFVSVADVARVLDEVITTAGHDGQAITVAGPEDLSMDQLVETVARTTGRTGRVDHVSPRMMRMVAAVTGIVNPVLADQVRAGLLMDTADMRAAQSQLPPALRALVPTTLDDVVRRELLTPA